MFTLYLHRNKINNKVYVGQTKRNPEDRWGPNGKGYKNQIFYKAIEKYGWENFDHIILEQVETQDLANQREEYYISLYDSTNPNKGYNLYKGGTVCRQTTTARQKRSLSMMGKNNPMYGKHKSDEAKEKLRQFLTSEKNPRLKKVICLTTGEIFPGCSFAAKKYNIKNSGDIGQCCRGKRKSCGKHPITNEPLRWQWYNKDSRNR